MSCVAPTTRRFSSAGFTMVEMIIVIVVVGVIFAIGALVLGRAFESYDLTRKTTDVDWQGRVAMERMVRELRQIRSATATDLAISATSTDPIYFNDADGNPVCFVLSAGSLRRGEDGPPGLGGCTTNLQPLADNVTSLNFNYYDNVGAATTTAVYYITVRLAVSENSVGGSINETYRVTLQPRRL